MAALFSYAKEIFPLGRVHYFVKNAEKDQFPALVKAIKKVLQPADQVLIKGSNSMNLANLVEELENEV